MKSLVQIIFAAVLSIGLASGCSLINFGDKENPENIKSKARNISGFTEIKAGNAVNLEISVQKDFGVVVEAGEKFQEDVKTEVKDETLVISTKGNFSPTNKVNIKISIPELKSLEIWGASEAKVSNMAGNSLKIQAGGTSKIIIDGQTKLLLATANGASLINAENLKTENAEVNTAGSSEVTISVSNELTANALGASSIIYLEEPKNIKQNLVGASTLRKK